MGRKVIFQRLKTWVLLIFVLFLAFQLIEPAEADELPVPRLHNSLIISLEHSVLDSAEVDYIKKNFP